MLEGMGPAQVVMNAPSEEQYQSLLVLAGQCSVRHKNKCGGGTVTGEVANSLKVNLLYNC